MRFVLLLFGGVAVILVAFVVIIRVVSSDTVPDCAQVRDPEPGAWQAGDFDARSQIVQELSFCERLQGRTQAEVEALLGPPSQTRPGELSYRLDEQAEPDRVPLRDAWVLFLGTNGRVRNTRFDVFTGF